MTKYECGHETDGVLILDSNPLSISAYLEWVETVGVFGDKSKCFECWERGRGEVHSLKEQFEKIRRKKVELRNDKHKGEALKFPYCWDHLKEEYGELLKAKEAGDKEKMTEELADLSNMCEFTFRALKGKGPGADERRATR